MPRSRSRSRERRRDSSRERRRGYRSRSREREHDYERYRGHDSKEDRGSERRHRDDDRGYEHRHRDDDWDDRRSRRDYGHSGRGDERQASRSGQDEDGWADQRHASRGQQEGGSKDDRLSRLQAWKEKQAKQAEEGGDPGPVTSSEPQAAPAFVSVSIPAAVAAKKAKLAAIEMQEYLDAQHGVGAFDPDPLDAFMSEAVLPEVATRAAEEAARKQEERANIMAQLASGKTTKKPEILEDSDEEVPDVEIQIPENKVKLVIGPNGTRIGEIQKRSKCRIQVKKEEDELMRAFGSGPKVKMPKIPKSGEEAEKKMTTLMLFGDSKAVEIAERMIAESIDNKEQKAKQREKEYERKREAKRRDRVLYHMRHTRDYEALEVPVGASKADVKKAYKKLAMQWHPDKHPEDPETAKAKFQEIQRAYDALMSTSEDDRIEQLDSKAT